MNDQPTPEAGEVIANPWESLRALTTARIALGRAGVSQPTRHHLAFQLAHAQARDAVHSALDLPRLQDDLATTGLDTIVLDSRADDRDTYLQRPDLGRRLSDAATERLQQQTTGPYDVAFIVADGLSALATQRHAVPLLQATLARLDLDNWRIAPISIVQQARVAISDEIGAALRATIAVILLGERPGLSAPDSLGIYLTHNPRLGATDADRNCISNIHSAGLSYPEAAHKLVYLLTTARTLGISGIALRDQSASIALKDAPPPR